MSLTESTAGGRAAVRLLQGYIWHPAEADLDLEQFLPRELDLTPGTAEDENAHVLWDKVNAPFAFFENGEPAAGQSFYQFTVLRVYEEKPDNDALHADAQAASTVLEPLLQSTPDGLGWQLWEDLREL